MYQCRNILNLQINNSIIYRINSSDIPMQTIIYISTATTVNSFGNFSIANTMIIRLDFRK